MLENTGVRYCDVSLPVPLDRTFTYELPVTLRHRAQVGSRVTVPFAGRTLTGVVLRVHDDAPDTALKQVTQLLDEEPVLNAELLDLAQWTARYYCAPLGEVLRAMTPVSAEVKKTRTYQLTAAGNDVARQMALVNEDDKAASLLRMLEARPLSADYLAKRVQGGARLLKDLEKKGLIEAIDSSAQRDIFRAPADQLTAQFLERPAAEEKLRKTERELLSYLELHPGPHLLSVLEELIRNSGTAARSLGKRGLLQLSHTGGTAVQIIDRPPHQLNAHQQAAFDAISEGLSAGEFRAFLLQGVTGSGKTEVYLRAIDLCQQQGKSALMLVPEIALTPAVAAQFHNRFGDRVAILHSAFSDLERVEQWRRIRRGQASVVIGTRSGIFAPVQNLGLIIVDEEHDNSYKQGETPRYSGRDLAIVRAQKGSALVVLGSATPSLETRHNASENKFTLLVLPERIENRPLPEVEILDMRQEFVETGQMDTFSRRLRDEIQARLEAKEQIVLLHNRRGFAPSVQCRACGHRVNCVNCAIGLTFHHRDRRLLCHYCSYAQPVPRKCPECGSDKIAFLGTGAEKVEHELHELFPTARIARLDRDTASSKQRFEDVLNGFRTGAYDLLVGTQMIAKGHDIPRVTLVGVVNSDIGLSMPDFRAAERTFQLLTQVAGRAGRGNMPGRVIFQTTSPDHYAVRYAAAQDYEGFYAKELEFRRAMRYPPLSALANLLVRHPDLATAQQLTNRMQEFLLPAPKGMHVLGPAEAPVPRLKNEFRFQCLVKSPSRRTLHEVLHALRRFTLEEKWPANALVIDVDPQSLL